MTYSDRRQRGSDGHGLSPPACPPPLPGSTHPMVNLPYPPPPPPTFTSTPPPHRLQPPSPHRACAVTFPRQSTRTFSVHRGDPSPVTRIHNAVADRTVGWVHLYLCQCLSYRAAAAGKPANRRKAGVEGRMGGGGGGMKLD